MYFQNGKILNETVTFGFVILEEKLIDPYRNMLHHIQTASECGNFSVLRAFVRDIASGIFSPVPYGESSPL